MKRIVLKTILAVCTLTATAGICGCSRGQTNGTEGALPPNYTRFYEGRHVAQNEDTPTPLPNFDEEETDKEPPLLHKRRHKMPRKKDKGDGCCPIPAPPENRIPAK